MLAPSLRAVSHPVAIKQTRINIDQIFPPQHLRKSIRFQSADERGLYVSSHRERDCGGGMRSSPPKGARVENSILGIIESGARYRVSIIRYWYHYWHLRGSQIWIIILLLSPICLIFPLLPPSVILFFSFFSFYYKPLSLFFDMVIKVKEDNVK